MESATSHTCWTDSRVMKKREFIKMENACERVRVCTTCTCEWLSEKEKRRKTRQGSDGQRQRWAGPEKRLLQLLCHSCSQLIHCTPFSLSITPSIQSPLPYASVWLGCWYQSTWAEWSAENSRSSLSAVRLHRFLTQSHTRLLRLLSLSAQHRLRPAPTKSDSFTPKRVEKNLHVIHF